MRQQKIDLGVHLEKFTPSDIKLNVEQRLSLERLSRHFSEDSHGPELREDRFQRTEVVKVDFPTMRDRYPTLYPSHFYRVALIARPLSFVDGEMVEALENLEGYMEENAVDRLVVFSNNTLTPAAVSVFKRANIQLINIGCIYINDGYVITNFVNHPGPFTEQTVYLNLLGEMLVKRLRKLFHLVLSEVAAPIYDDHYGEGRPATQRIQKKEESIIAEVVEGLNERNIAIDVGCGTGRHSLHLARKFTRTVGFDFSPLMIERANANKRDSEAHGSIDFHISDVEYESLPGEDALLGRVDLVCASFGMGSFVENTDRLIRKFATWLSPAGKAVISFYNSEPASKRLKPDWRNSALAATVDAESDILRVELSEGATFNIYCKSYTPVLRSNIERYLNIERTIHFPTTLALMPADMVKSRENADFFGRIDDLLCEDESNVFGFYVTLVCSKIPGADVNVESARAELRALGRAFSVVEHGPAFTAKAARTEILQQTDFDEADTLFLKAVVFHVGGHGSRARPVEDRQFALVLLPWDQRVDEERLAQALGVTKNRVEGADRETLFQLGFPLGGVGPFGVRHLNTRRFINAGCLTGPPKRLVFGSGSHLSSIVIDAGPHEKLFAQFEPL